QAEDGIRDFHVTGVQTCALPISLAAGGGVAAVADAHAPLEQRHRVLVEHVAHEPVALVHAQAGAVAGRDAGRVLAAMLEHGQAVIQTGRDLGGSDDADDAAHGGGLPDQAGAMAQGCGRTRPSMPKPDCTRAFSCSASAGVATGPAFTRVRRPRSVCTLAVKAPMPAARRRSRSASASAALLKAPSCTAKPVPLAAGAGAGAAGAAAGVEGVGAGADGRGPAVPGAPASSATTLARAREPMPSARTRAASASARDA